jgi:hypothetical protein
MPQNGSQGPFFIGHAHIGRRAQCGDRAAKIKPGARRIKSVRRNGGHRPPTAYAQCYASSKQTLFVFWSLPLAYIPRRAANTLFSAQTDAFYLISLAWLLLKLKQLGRVL